MVVLRVLGEESVLGVMPISTRQPRGVLAVRLVQVLVGICIVLLQVVGATLRGSCPGLAGALAGLIGGHQAVPLEGRVLLTTFSQQLLVLGVTQQL